MRPGDGEHRPSYSARPSGTGSFEACAGASTPAAQAAGFGSISRSRMPKTTPVNQAARALPRTQGASLQGTSKEVGLRQGGEGSPSPGRMAEEQSKYYTCPLAGAPSLPACAEPSPLQGSVCASHPSAGAGAGGGASSRAPAGHWLRMSSSLTR